jgi:antitoxin component YwqK of YwqJK toxin-antitoxin module
MKKLLLLTLSILTLYACGQKTSLIYSEDCCIDWDVGTEIMSYKGTPFSGDITGYYSNRYPTPANESTTNNQLREKENYKDGKKDGLFEKYYEDGKIRSKFTYKDGKPIGIGEYFSDNGNLVEKRTHYDGELHVLWERYDEQSGKLYRRYTTNQKYKRYAQTPLDGVSEEWYGNGQLQSRETYKEGYLEGISVSYYENGEIWEKRTYKKGKIVRTE